LTFVDDLLPRRGLGHACRHELVEPGEFLQPHVDDLAVTRVEVLQAAQVQQ
jgi:hypothetical protein